ncbi:hypothetical protein HJC99_06915 [Candidatus Saccharibacteria bacterium]|nr:hypothetical protein [Candidatus Saccharibacteria bacterium]
MPAPRKAVTKPANRPQEFRNTLTPTMPLAPDLSLAPQLNRTGLMLAGGIIGVMLVGILGGLALRPLFTPTITVTAGPVAAVTNPQYTRILQAKAVAGIQPQTVQMSTNGSMLQLADSSSQLQTGGDINQLQPVLSAYDSQGSVGGPAR